MSEGLEMGKVFGVEETDVRSILIGGTWHEVDGLEMISDRTETPTGVHVGSTYFNAKLGNGAHLTLHGLVADIQAVTSGKRKFRTASF